MIDYFRVVKEEAEHIKQLWERFDVLPVGEFKGFT